VDYKSKLTLSIFVAVFGIATSFGSDIFQMSFGTICFECPGAQFHLDEAKRSIDSGDYDGAKNHIDQAKQLIGHPEASQSTNSTSDS
jgi:hypothetical protein